MAFEASPVKLTDVETVIAMDDARGRTLKQIHQNLYIRPHP